MVSWLLALTAEVNTGAGLRVIGVVDQIDPETAVREDRIPLDGIPRALLTSTPSLPLNAMVLPAPAVGPPIVLELLWMLIPLPVLPTG